jgi:DNA-binding CsgD family transcriptional regulator
VWAIAEPVYARARRLGARTHEAELGYWLVKAGRPIEAMTTDHPYALLASGRWREAAAVWRAAGCPYEYAAALAESPEPKDLLLALDQLTALGARPLVATIRTRLRGLGVNHLPRGPYRSARENPAGLTARQRDVLQLLCQGLTNAEIAQRLVLSVRTVDNHVGAALAKIGAGNRREAARLAADLGLLESENRGAPGEA